MIRKSSEYGKVYKEGRRYQGDGFSLIVLENDLKHSRLGISIHRQLKGAVKRNRIKRIIREAFRIYRDVFAAESDIVVAVRPGFKLDSPRHVGNAVAALLGKNPVE